MHPVIGYVIAVGLFAIGLYGVLTRRNAVLQLAAAELMLGGVHLVLVTTDLVHGVHTGQSFALFIVVIAAAEIGVGLALVLNLWRARSNIDTDGLPYPDREAETGRHLWTSSLGRCRPSPPRPDWAGCSCVAASTPSGWA